MGLKHTTPSARAARRQTRRARWARLSIAALALVGLTLGTLPNALADDEVTTPEETPLVETPEESTTPETTPEDNTPPADPPSDDTTPPQEDSFGALATSANLTVNKAITSSDGLDTPSFRFLLEVCTTNASSCPGYEDVEIVTVVPGTPHTFTGLFTPDGGGGLNYRITELDEDDQPGVPAGWALTGRSCSGASQTGTGAGVPATAIVVRLTLSNTNAQCTFTDRDDRGTITARKIGLRGAGNGANLNLGSVTGPAGFTNNLPDGFGQALLGAAFEYSDDNGATWKDLCVTDTIVDNTATCTVPLAAGSYQVREKADGAPAGWSSIQTVAAPGGFNASIADQAYIQIVNVNANNVGSPNDTSNTRRFVNSLDNPARSSECGIDLALLLDGSGSIFPNRAAYSAAVQGFIDDLSGTPTTLKVYRFGESAASAVQIGSYNLADGTAAGLAKTDVNTFYTGLGTGVGTNWDAGLQALAGSGADVGIVLTDGNPTVRNGAITTNDTVDVTELEAGILSANRVKSNGISILALGIGSAVSTTNLELISGPGSFFHDDVPGLDALLNQIAVESCGGTITITKEELVSGSYTIPANSWTFVANGGGFTDESKSTVVDPPNPATVTYEFDASELPATVTITEQVLVDWLLNQGETDCNVDFTPVLDSEENFIGVELTVDQSDIVTCLFRNDPIDVQATGTVRVTKRVIINGVETTGPESAGTYRMTVESADTAHSDSEDLTEGGDSAGFVVPVGPGYSVTEDESLLLPDWELVGIECEATESDTRQGQSVDPASFEVQGGELIDCLVTNDPAVEVGGISVLPLTGSPLGMALKTAAWLLGLGGLLYLVARRRRHRLSLAE